MHPSYPNPIQVRSVVCCEKSDKNFQRKFTRKNEAWNIGRKNIQSSRIPVRFQLEMRFEQLISSTFREGVSRYDSATGPRRKKSSTGFIQCNTISGLRVGPSCPIAKSKPLEDLQRKRANCRAWSKKNKRIIFSVHPTARNEKPSFLNTFERGP